MNMVFVHFNSEMTKAKHATKTDMELNVTKVKPLLNHGTTSEILAADL